MFYLVFELSAYGGGGIFVLLCTGKIFLKIYFFVFLYVLFLIIPVKFSQIIVYINISEDNVRCAVEPSVGEESQP